MSNFKIPAEVEKAINSFKSQEFVMMTPLELGKTIELDPNIFDDCCQFYFLPSSLRAIAAGRLKVTFKKRKKSVKTKVQNSQIYIGSKRGNIVIYCRGTDFCIFLGEGTKLGKSSEQSFDIKLSSKSIIFIGDNTSCNSAELHSGDCYIKIGKDCMLSSEIIIQGNDGHGIIDLDLEVIVNNIRHFIEIEDHVWLGRRVMILPGAKIGKGSIIGAGSILTKEIESMSVAVGVPAKTIKKGFTWTREANRFDEYSEQAILSYKEKSSEK